MLTLDFDSFAVCIQDAFSLETLTDAGELLAHYVGPNSKLEIDLENVALVRVILTDGGRVQVMENDREKFIIQVPRKTGISLYIGISRGCVGIMHEGDSWPRFWIHKDGMISGGKDSG